MTSPIEDEFTELVDADIPRVDLVGKAANGTRFLIAKQADGNAGLMSPDLVRDLIGKPEPTSASEEMVTMTGSPAAIAKMIHQAAQRATEPNSTPSDPAADGSLEKESAVALPDDLDPAVILAEPDDTAPGNPTTPGSPAWEAIDAATARKWTSILARARSAIDMLADRELMEAAAGDDDDTYQAMDLQDACCALDYAISVLAPFAVAEQAEADCGEEMAAVGKALAHFDPAPLDTIEVLGAVAKAGRSLSAANEQAIRGAVESLQKVLASLPAPTADVEKVANEEPDMPTPTTSADTTTASGQEPAMGVTEPEPQQPAGMPTAEPVGKATEKTPMVVVYDQKGRLIGIVDPDDVTPVANSEADAEEMDDEADTSDDEDEDGGEELTPQPPAETGTPADAVPDDEPVTKTTHPTHDTTSDTVLKSIATDAVRAELDAYSATQEQVIAKQATDLAQMTKSIEELTALVKALEEQPATPKVFTNGAVPPRDLRGMDHGTPPVDITRARELKKGLYGGGTAADQNRAANELTEMAIARLQEIQRP